jgi:hypothetical protein
MFCRSLQLVWACPEVSAHTSGKSASIPSSFISADTHHLPTLHGWLLILLHKNIQQARCQWVRSVILTTWEAEIGRITVQGQPRQIVGKTLSPK